MLALYHDNIEYIGLVGTILALSGPYIIQLVVQLGWVVWNVGQCMGRLYNKILVGWFGWRESKQL